MSGHPSSASTPATRFDRDTAVTPVAAGTFSARIERDWWIVAGPNGGYLNAIVLNAMRATVDDEAREPRTLTTHFVSRPVEGAATLHTRVERSGRSLSTVRAWLEQEDRLVASSIGALSRPRKGGIAFQDARPPEVPAPHAVPLRAAGAGPDIPFHRQLEQRPVFGNASPDGGAAAVGGGWIRLVEPRGSDASLLAMLVDAWPPSIFQKHAPPPGHRGVPTVELTTHFRAPEVALALPAGAYHLVRFTTRTSRDGFLEEDGEVWSEGGVLLAQSRQLALFG